MTNLPNVQQGTQFGVTQPLSLTLPTLKDEQQTLNLINQMKQLNQYEDNQQALKRLQVLASLHSLLSNFVYSVSKSKSLPDSIAKIAGLFFLFRR